jgi:hypothetical protein
MILEGIVTTLDPSGRLNVAPMGPRVDPDFRRFVLRPFRGSNTYRNLSHHGEGVLHVTDDVLLLARSAIGDVHDAPSRPAKRVHGRVLTDCCRYYEFRVTAVDDREERASFFSETVHEGRSRDHFGFNRAKHSVIEVAILATRIDFLPPGEVIPELEKHRLIVNKTGGERETQALELLDAHIRSVALRRGFDLGRPSE